MMSTKKGIPSTNFAELPLKGWILAKDDQNPTSGGLWAFGQSLSTRNSRKKHWDFPQKLKIFIDISKGYALIAPMSWV
jgi:hypothetical protein